MHLREPYFNAIKSGRKKIELRLYDEKRQQIELGDKIIFTNDDDKAQKLTTEVIGLLRYQNFADIFADFDVSFFAGDETDGGQMLSVMNDIYSEEKQEKYGIVGLRLRLAK